MNSKLLLISISIITLASCSTAYKTGQTPDDVYYSPVRYYGEEEKKGRKKEEECNIQGLCRRKTDKNEHL